MRQHGPRLKAHIEAHASETVPSFTSTSYAQQCALHVGALLVARGVQPRQLEMRAWGRGVSRLMRWKCGVAEIFLEFIERPTLPRVMLPPRPAYYYALREQEALAPTSVPTDERFWSALDQEMNNDPEIRAVFEKMRTLELTERPKAWAAIRAAEPELEWSHSSKCGGSLWWPVSGVKLAAVEQYAGHWIVEPPGRVGHMIAERAR